MGSPRKSPSQFQRSGTAFIWFIVWMLVLFVAAVLFYQVFIRGDYESYTDGKTPVTDFVPKDGYLKIEYPEYAMDPDSEPTPLPVPTPRVTPIPLDDYALVNKRLLIPETYDVVLADLVECRSSSADDGRALVVRGWGYLENRDALNAQIYLVVSTKFGENHRFYLTRRLSGSSGLVHDATTGRNLDQADFAVNVRVEDTYTDGEYRMGIMVIAKEGSEQYRGYTRLDPKYNFNVLKGKITDFLG